MLLILHIFSTCYLVTLVKPTWNLNETHMKPWLISTCYWFCTFSTHETHMKPWSIGTRYWFFTFSAHKTHETHMKPWSIITCYWFFTFSANESLMKPIWNLDQSALIIHFAHFQYTLPCYLDETHMKPSTSADWSRFHMGFMCWKCVISMTSAD